MNEEELLEALKILNTPITIHNETYHYFDDENFNNLKRVFENCQYVLTKEEYIMQNAIDNKKKAEQLTNNWNELEEWLKEQKEDANKCIEWNKNKNQYYDEYKRDIARFDFILDKMKEIKEGK